MAIVYLIAALLVAILAVIFAVYNPGTVDLAFFSWNMKEVSLSLVLLITLVIGVLIGWLTAAPSLVKHTFRASGQRKRVTALEKELEDHKTKLSELQKPAPVVSTPKPATPPPADRPAPIPASKPTDTDPLQHS
jgi:putative membrane protein